MFHVYDTLHANFTGSLNPKNNFPFYIKYLKWPESDATSAERKTANLQGQKYQKKKYTNLLCGYLIHKESGNNCLSWEHLFVSTK